MSPRLYTITDPLTPDGRWCGAWPPEVWLTRWRLAVLGYRGYVTIAALQAITQRARDLYIVQYGHEPPRRGTRRTQPYTIVFEHARVQVLDAAAAEILGPPPPRKGR